MLIEELLATINADRDREIGVREDTLRSAAVNGNGPLLLARYAARHLSNLRAGQIGSTQITLTGGNSRPGSTVNVWRTSR